MKSNIEQLKLIGIKDAKFAKQLDTLYVTDEEHPKIVYRGKQVQGVNPDELQAVLADYPTKEEAIENPETAGTSGQILKLGEDGPEWANPAEGSVMDSEMSDVSENPVKNKVIKEYVDETKDETLRECDETFAKQDGFYESLVSGAAKNLLSKGNALEGSFFSRTTGGDAEVSNGLAQLLEVRGNSVKVNQLAYLGNSRTVTVNGITWVIDTQKRTVTAKAGGTTTAYSAIQFQDGVITDGHKFYVAGCPDGGSDTTYRLRFTYGNVSELGGGKIITGNGIIANLSTQIVTGYEVTSDIVFKPQLIDLTALGIDNLTTVEEVETWLAENWGAKEYYDYNAGSVVNVNMTGVESVGFNLLDPVTNKAQIIGAYSEVYGNYYGIIGTYTSLSFEDKLGNVTAIVPDADGKFELTDEGTLTVDGASTDTCVFLWWDGTETEYKEHEVNVAKIDIPHIYGKKNGEGDLVQIFPNGAAGVGSVQDTIKVENGVVVAKKMMGVVDLGNLSWDRDEPVFFATVSGLKSGTTNALLAKYEYENPLVTDKHFGTEGSIGIIDSSYSDTPSFATAMNGVMFYYELATPETYTDLVYQGSSLYADGTPVTLPVSYEVDNWGIENILPKNTSTILTAKPTVGIKYTLDAVETLDTHTTQIENLQEGALDYRYARKSGVENDLVVGAAKTLAGNHRINTEFTSMIIDGADGIAKINEVKGKSIVWNQKMFCTSNTYNKNNVTIDVNRVNNSVTISTTSEGASNYVVGNLQSSLKPIKIIEGHKYFYGINSNLTDVRFSEALINDGLYSTSSYGIATATNTVNQVFCIRVTEGTIITTPITVYPILIDLTLMFGEGNEPATVEEFEALFPNDYYEYNEGEIISNKTEQLNVSGFNQWDEEWESGGINSVGVKYADNAKIRSKNYIPIFPETAYYFKSPVGIPRVAFYDSNKTFISVDYPYVNAVYTTPSDVRYMLVSFDATTYNNDVCINISNPNKNGTYEPYKHNDVMLNLATITGKLNGEGESVTVFPNGMRSAGNVYDSLVVDEDGFARKAIVRIGSVDMGSLMWTKETNETSGYIRFRTFVEGYNGNNRSNICCGRYIYGAEPLSFQTQFKDKTISGYQPNLLLSMDDAYSSGTAEQYKAAMDGVEAIYELATYQEYVLDTPIPMTFQAYNGGVIRQDPVAPDSAPMAMNVTFAIDALGTLNSLPKNYISAESMDAFLAQLSTAMGGTWTKTWNDNTGKWEFSYVAGGDEPQPESND